MSSSHGDIHTILTHSFVDGPGNRAVVFCQGCNLDCVYCHNPHTINPCSQCGVCVHVCPVSALSMVEDQVHWDAARCIDCEACVNSCPSMSTPRARHWTAEKLWKYLKPYRCFLDGITLSGGEPLLQEKFLIDFLSLVKSQSDLTSLIQTNGTAIPEHPDLLLPVLDYVMVDLKAGARDVYHALTGNDGSAVRESISFFHKHEKLLSVRQVVVPGFTDTILNARQTARVIADVDLSIPLHFIRFRPHGTRGTTSTWQAPSEKTMQQVVAAAQSEGLLCVTSSQ